MRVENVGAYRLASTGRLWFHGEVVNTSPRPLGDIGITLSVFNDRGERLARGSAESVSANVLAPGERGVFEVDMSDAPGSWTRTEVEVGLQPGSRTIQAEDDPNVEASGVQARPTDGGGLEVRGTVRNTGDQPIRNIRTAAALYDASGKLLAASQQGTLVSGPNELGPRATAEFRVTFPPRQPALPTSPARVEVWATAHKTP